MELRITLLRTDAYKALGFALGHSEVWIESKLPTCENLGYVTGYLTAAIAKECVDEEYVEFVGEVDANFEKILDVFFRAECTSVQKSIYRFDGEAGTSPASAN